ncbi:MAG: threonine/serine exporter family protein, partial [Acidobacteria bacterium]|nr:threonine/serine exporter family protein [Acidobacteriota bacterium]
LAPWTQLPALLVAAWSFTVLFRARPRDFGWIFVAGAIALLGARVGAHWLGPELGALVGAVLLGTGSNLYARRLDRPSATTQLPGLMLLVPGSLGFRGMAALLERDTLTGLQTAFSMTVVAIALVTGLLIANVVLPPRRSL